MKTDEVLLRLTKYLNTLAEEHLKLQQQILALTELLGQSISTTDVLITKVKLLEQINEKLSTHISQISKN